MVLYCTYMNRNGSQSAVDQDHGLPQLMIAMPGLGVGQGSEVHPVDTNEASEAEEEGENRESEPTHKESMEEITPCNGEV